MLLPFGKGPEDITGFESCLLADLNTHGSEHFFHQRDLFTEFLRHGFTGSLVFRIGLMAEGRCMNVESNCQIVRLQFVQLAEKDVQKTVDRTGMHAFCIGQIRHSVESPVQDTVAVYKQKLLFIRLTHDKSSLFPSGLQVLQYQYFCFEKITSDTG